MEPLWNARIMNNMSTWIVGIRVCRGLSNTDYREWLWLNVQYHRLWLNGSGEFSSESRSVVSDSLPPYTVHGMLQAIILEWVAFPFSRGSSQPGIEPRSPTLLADSLPAEPHGKLKNTGVGKLSLLQWIFLTQELNRVSCIAGRFFTNCKFPWHFHPRYHMLLFITIMTPS